MIASAKTRALVGCCVLATGFTGFSFRLVDLQVTRHEEYAAMAAESHGLRQTIFARRGAIYDIHNQPLAANEPVRTIAADASKIGDKAELARFLAKPLEMTEAALVEKLSRERWSEKEQKMVPARYIVLKKGVPEPVADDLIQRIAEIDRKKDQKDPAKAKPGQATPAPTASVVQEASGYYTIEEAKTLAKAGVRAIMLEQDSNRVYPNKNMLSHVVGFVDAENKGVDGVEKTMDDFLKGHDGLRFSERDRTGKELVPFRSQERPARDGANVRLTIDLSLQDIVETELAAAVKQYRPKMAIGIMMRPQTGEILAMANRPDFDPNDVDASPLAARRNRAITDMVEPGSTFKITVVSGALQQHLVHPDTMIPTENGYFTYMGRVLRDTHPFPELSVHDIIVHSSNIGAAKLGIQLGDQRLYEWVRKFGFGDRTGVQLPGEINGLVHPVYHWDKLTITRIPMGQSVCVTPLQVVTAMSAIANGGSLMMPQIVHDVTDCEGHTVTAFPPVEVRRVISPEVAAEVRQALQDVMSKKGTGKDIHVPGFLVAGKTGTAQKAGENGIGYEKGKYIVSFVGFMPVDNPQFVCLVMLDDCQVEANKNYGGTIAGPIFAKIAERAARHLGLEPSQELLQEQSKAAADSERAND